MMYLQLPTIEQKAMTRREFNATEETIQADIRHLIEWMAKQPHLPTLTGKCIWFVN